LLVYLFVLLLFQHISQILQGNVGYAKQVE
jgi:hypothetical protein